MTDGKKIKPDTAPLVSQAITMRKNAQVASEQRSAQFGGYLEGGA